MKRPKQKMRRATWTLAISCFLVILLAAPIVISDRYHRLVLQTGAVLAAASNSYSLSAPIRLMSGPTIELESGTLSVPPSRTGLARGGQMIAMLITGSGPQMTLENATFTADFSTREPTFSQEKNSGEVAPLLKAMQTMQFDGLAVRDSTVRIKMSDDSLVELENVIASISTQPNGAIRAVGSFDFHGETINFDTTLGVSLDTQGMSRPLSASFSGKPITATLDGRLMMGDSPQLLSPLAEISSPDLRSTARWLGVNWPSGSSFGAFRTKGQLEWVNRTVAFQNAAITLDDNEASGTLSVNFSGARPAVEGTLGLKALDLTRYLKQDDPQSGPDSILSAVRNASGLEFPLIQAVDADLRISSDTVTLPATTIGRSAATVSLRNGKMLADIAELEFSDGTRGGGQMRIDMSGANPNYAMQVKFEAPDIGRTLQWVFGHPTVQGHGIVTIDLAATGNTGDSLLKSLNGKLCATLPDGGRVGLDINTLAAPVSTSEVPLNWQEISGRAISVDRLDTRFIVANGVASAQTAEAASGERALKAEGTINLLDQRLDMHLTLGDLATPASQGDGDPAATAAIQLLPRQTIDMHGPWSAPDIIMKPAPESQAYGPPSPG
ncbi:MAG: AsmA-like C-terminal region-containing protein [Hyphomicrobium sp.]|jgi:AsmA protein